MGKNKTRSKSALKQNSVTAENKRLGDDGNINFTFKIFRSFCLRIKFISFILIFFAIFLVFYIIMVFITIYMYLSTPIILYIVIHFYNSYVLYVTKIKMTLYS